MAAAPPANKYDYKVLRANYDILSTKASAGDSLIPDTAYADFLKRQEGQNLPNMVPDLSIHEVGAPGKKSHRHRHDRPLSANTIREKAQRSLDDSAKRLQAIEDHMWQHRQEERDLKRIEIDLVKKKRHVQRSMKEYEDKISHQHIEEAQTLQGKEEAADLFRKKDLHRRKEERKDRTQVALVGRQKLNEITKKFVKTENEMGWRYRNLVECLEQKRSEVEKLSKDFQNKLRAKEEEQLKLKKELADVAISLNMEAHKLRQAEAENTRELERTNKKDIQGSLSHEDSLRMEDKSMSIAGQKFENSRRSIHHSLKEKQNTAALKQRQSGRSLMDVRSRMQTNAETQRLIAREVEHIELTTMGQEMSTKAELVESRKRLRDEAAQRKREEKNIRELRDWEQRFVSMENQSSKKEQEDSIKQLAHTVAQYDHLEHDIYSRAKGAESERKKHNQMLNKMQDDLNYLKRENARRIKAVALEAEKAEKELQKKIQLENSELTKAANVREESLRSLAAHRAQAQEERNMLSVVKREQQRKVRIQSRSAFLSQSTY